MKQRSERSVFILFLFLFFLVLYIPGILARSPYKIDQRTETIMIGSGVGLMGVGLFYDFSIPALTEDEIAHLSKDNLNPLDRSATNNWSPSASKMSDILLFTYEALPLSFLFDKKIRDDFNSYVILGAETAIFSLGANILAKGVFKRPRPYVYNTDIPLGIKTTTRARRSFYSGHTTIAFTSAVLTSKLYEDYFPNSKWRTTIWTTSILGASLVGYLRYSSGQHFPTDIITGAVMGSLFGYMILELHKEATNDALSSPKTPFQIALVFKI